MKAPKSSIGETRARGWARRDNHPRAAAWMQTMAGRMRDSHRRSTGARARAAIIAISAALKGADMSRLRTRPAPGMACREAGATTKARRATASGKCSMPPSRERRSAISLSSDDTHAKSRRQLCRICNTKRRLSSRLRRSALVICP